MSFRNQCPQMFMRLAIVPNLFNTQQDVKHRNKFGTPEKMMGETIAQSICGNKTAYKTWVWFKFCQVFDIEYKLMGNCLQYQ